MLRVGAGQSRCVRGLALTLAAGVCFVLWSAPALAGKGVVSVFGSGGSGDGQFTNAAGTAVNLASGDVYVVDQFDHRVERFDSSGGFLGAFGWGVADGNTAAQTCSGNCQTGIPGSGDGQFDTPQGVAVDQADGSVYVVDGNNNRVEKFDSTGNYLSQFGSAGSAEGQFSGPQGIAVDPTDGSVYIADAGNNRVEKFDNTGASTTMFGFGVADGNSAFETCASSCQSGLAVGDDGGLNFPTRVAVDSTGQVYVLDSGNGRIERYTAANAFDEVFDPTDVNINTFAFEIAVGPGNDHLYVAQAAPDFSEQRVFEIDATGTLIDIHGAGSTAGNASGLALSSGSQKIYLADGFNARVFILDDITAATLTIDSATGITSMSASLSATITPNGDPPVGWHFEISADDANWGPVAADQDAGNGNTPVPVSQNLSGLVPNTTYFVRLAATRPFNPPTYSDEIQVATTAITPDATTDVADDVTPSHAVLTGLVHPHNSVTTYYFEYGVTTDYSTSVPAAQDGDAGAGNQITGVLQRVDGLQPATTYHYRLVATNSAGTTNGDDRTFATTTVPASSTPRAGIPGTGILPDNRGWEKVSPNDKNGGDIMADSGRAHVAADGSAAGFASLAAFGDAIGTSVATDYMSVRGSDQWATHANTPPQSPLSVKAVTRGMQTLYEGFSGSLSKGVLLAWSPVTDDPNVANVGNLYLREDPMTAGPGIYQLLSICPLCAATNTPLPPLPAVGSGGAGPRFAGASADFGHVIFETQQPLTSEAPSGCTNLGNLNQCPGNLYEWDHGVVRLAGILPDSACGSPPCPAHGSQAGQGAGGYQAQTELTPHTISADGSRIFFTVPSSPGSRNGALYMRVAHSTTVQLNASERTAPESPKRATYWDASADGLRMFFTTTESLTDDAPSEGNKLYMYDAAKPDTDPHNLTLVSTDGAPDDSGEVINVQGASSDGHYIYFAAAGQLVAGRPWLGTIRALYVWHDGIMKYIVSMGDFFDNLEDTNTAFWSFTRPTARVTPDGLHLLFSSSQAGPGPTGYDQGHCQTLAAGCREFYLYSYASDRLSCVSCNPSGTPASASAFIVQRLNTSAAATSPAQNRPLSDDGQWVFFSTAEGLVSQDSNSKVDVYRYEASTGTVHLLTTGSDRSDSYFMNASPSGKDALFLTRAQLAHGDGDNNYDMYDARVDGGYLEPPPSGQRCSGDACQGPQGQTRASPRRGSSLIAARQPAPKIKRKPKSCRKGYVRKKVRGRTACVKKRKTHKTRKPKHRRSQRRAK